MMRGEMSNFQRYAAETSAVIHQPPRENSVVDAYGESTAYDRLREQPIEGVDAYGAIPEDLLAAAAPVAPAPAPAAASVEQGPPVGADAAITAAAPKESA
jgi:hypothetical protein